MHTHTLRPRRWLRFALAGVVMCLPLGWVVATVTPVYAAGPALDVKVSADYPGSSNTFVTPVMSTAGPNEVIVVFAGQDGASPTVTSVTGGGLAFTLAKRSNTGAGFGDAEIWTAIAPAQLSGVAFTANMSQITQGGITAAAFTGVDPGNPVGASGANGVANGVTATETVAVTPAHSGSIIWADGYTAWGGGGRTAAGGQLMQHDYENPPNGDAWWVQSVTATTTAGTPVTVTTTTTGGVTAGFNYVAVELQPNPGRQTFTETIGAGTLSVTAPANATLAAQSPATTIAAQPMGAMTFVNTLNDGAAWSVTLAATDFGAAKVPFTNLTIGVTTAANYTPLAGNVGTPTAGSASQTLAGADGSPGTTFSTAITLVSAAGGNTVDGTWTTPAGTTGNTITETVPATTAAGTYTSTFQYTITG